MGAFVPKSSQEIIDILNETYDDFNAISIDDALRKLVFRKILAVEEQKFSEACKFRDLEKILLSRVSFEKISRELNEPKNNTTSNK